MAKVRVVVAGFKGRMGETTCKMVLEHNDEFELVGGFDPRGDASQTLGAQTGLENADSVPAFSEPEGILSVKPDVWVDFTTPTAVKGNVEFCIKNHISPVVGTTGMSDDDVAELQAAADKAKLGGLIVPNFGLSAVLLMKFAQEAVKYFPDVEIIELHHGDKKDAPSGTALQTAKLMAQNRKPREQSPKDEIETLKGVRGGDYQGMHIHSVRLPGLIAHEMVQFGGVGEGLTIRQDSYDRKSFMTGVELAVRKVRELTKLEVGLDKVL